jgi:hypothetical protein
MARSLTVQHEENVQTTGLLNGFLLFAAGWMLLNALTWAADADPADLSGELATPATMGVP